MLIITAGSKVLPKLNVYTDQQHQQRQQQRLGSHSAIPICAAAGLLIIFCFILLPSLLPRLTRRLARWKSPPIRTNTTEVITWSPEPKQPLSRTPPNAAAAVVSPAFTRPEQRRRRSSAEPLAAAGNLTSISRGEPGSGTAPVGLLGRFGARPLGSMTMMEGEEGEGEGEEDKTTTIRLPAATSSRSRGVSTDWSEHGLLLPGPDHPSSSSSSFPDIEQGHHHHVISASTPSPAAPPPPSRRDGGGPASAAELGQSSSSMDRDGLEEGLLSTGAHTPATTFLSRAAHGHMFVDDGSVFYGATTTTTTPRAATAAAGPARDRSTTPRAFYLVDFDTRPPPPSPSPAFSSGSDTSTPAPPHGAPTLDRAWQRQQQQQQQATASIPIVSPAPRTPLTDETMMSASSYPSASPALPPPPVEEYRPFDPSAVMYSGPGAVVDGGLRTVSPPRGDDARSGLGCTQRPASLGHSGIITSTHADWKRHTRVYEGGVCLACAAAEDGGFYGARVRPEDKR